VFTPALIASILPEILILVLGMILLVIEPFWREENRRNIGWLTAIGLLISMIVSLIYGRPGEPLSVFGGMIRFDWLGFFFKMLFMFAAAMSALLLMDHEKAGRRGESYLLLLASLMGMNLMAVSSDLIMLYLSIETASIPLYILAGFMTADVRSTEAGFKYFLFGTVTSTVMLYGFSLVFGFAGTTDTYQLSEMFAAGDLSLLFAFGLIALILVGLGFKVTIVPFQFWAPDVYQGAPTPVAGFLSTASKAAGFAVLLRLLFVGFAFESTPEYVRTWAWTLAVLAAITMTVGNLIALPQTNIKRLLAYSSVAHAGYTLVGLVAFTPFGAASVVFYLIAYIATNLLCWPPSSR
jgi:NADH-quinone oxidoreductase subunit N